MNILKNIIATLAVLFAMNGTAGKIIKPNKPVNKSTNNGVQKPENIQIGNFPQIDEHSPVCRGDGSGA
jgi:hypothetical protein